MALNKIGSQIVLQGLQAYLSGVQSAQQAVISFSGASAQAGAGFSSASAAVQHFGANVTNLGNFLQRTGFILSFQLTAPLLALGKAVTGAATDFEDSFAGVRKTVDGTEDDFKRLARQLRDLALVIPVDVNELNRIAEAAGQVGISKNDIVSFTETVAKLSVATNLGVDASEDLARIANIMGTRDFPNLGSAIVDLGNKSAATEQEIVNMALRLAGAGKTIGLTTPEVLGIATALSSVGVRAEAGGSAFSRVFIDMAKAVAEGGKELTLFGQVSGMTGANFARTFKQEPAQAIIAFVNGLNKIQESGGNLFRTLDDLDLNEIRVRDSLLRAASAGDLMQESITTGNTAWRDNNALNAEAAERFKTTTNQLQLMRSSINDNAIDIGNIFLPRILSAAKDFTDQVVRLAKGFEALNPQTQDFIVKMGLFVALTAPVLTVLGALTSLVGIVIQLAGVIGAGAGVVVAFTSSIANAIAVLGPGQGLIYVLGGVGGALVSLGLAFAGVGLVIAGLASDFGGMRRILVGLHDQLAVILPKAVENLVGIFQSEFAAIGQVFDWLGSEFGKPLRMAGEAKDQLFAEFESWIGTFGPQFNTMGTQMIYGLWDGFRNGLGQLKDNFLGAIGGLVQAAKDQLGIHSPSTIFYTMGGQMAGGMNEGWLYEFDKTKLNIVNSVTGLTQAVLKPIVSMQDQITNMLTSRNAFNDFIKSMKNEVAQGNLGFAAEQFIKIGASAEEAKKSVIALFDEIQKDEEKLEAETAKLREKAEQEAQKIVEALSDIGLTWQALIVDGIDQGAVAIHNNLERLKDDFRSFTEEQKRLSQTWLDTYKTMTDIENAATIKRFNDQNAANISAGQQAARVAQAEEESSRLALAARQKAKSDLETNRQADIAAGNIVGDAYGFGNLLGQAIQQNDVLLISSLVKQISAMKSPVHSVAGLAEAFARLGGYFDAQDNNQYGHGGIVPGSGTSDSVPAMLTPGEWVLPVHSLGARLLALLSGPGGLGMESILSRTSSFPLGAMASGSVTNINVNANYTNPQQPQTLALDMQTIAMQMAT